MYGTGPGARVVGLAKLSHAGMGLGSRSRFRATPMLLDVIGKSTDFRAGLTRVQISALPPTSFVTLSKLSNSKPQFVHL